MNEFTLILAILVIKGVITDKEARNFQKCLTEGVVNSDLKQMLDKVERSITVKEQPLEVIDAKTILS